MRRVMVAVAIASTAVAAMGGIAHAGEIEVVPGSVPAPGEVEFDITLTDFDPDTPVFVLPCETPESGDPEDIDGETCAITDVAAAMTDSDGTAMLKLIWNVPAEGVAFVAGNESRTDAASALVTVEETQVLGTTQPNPQDPVDTLPDTGSETWVLLGIAAALLAGGAATSVAGRRVAPA